MSICCRREHIAVVVWRHAKRTHTHTQTHGKRYALFDDFDMLISILHLNLHIPILITACKIVRWIVNSVSYHLASLRSLRNHCRIWFVAHSRVCVGTYEIEQIITSRSRRNEIKSHPLRAVRMHEAWAAINKSSFRKVLTERRHEKQKTEEAVAFPLRSRMQSTNWKQ